MHKYRSDIEGLRAIAVVLVILYHYQFPGITGGFVGVDVFFVISGFVITRMLSARMAEGGFRFAEFYTRRILRLVPVFLLVSFVTFLAISPFYFDDDYYIFAKSWMAALLGLSNFYFYAELSQYFSPEAGVIPLLHTWSLAVEEQFYLFWPAALLLFTRWVRPAHQLGWFIALWGVAFALSVYMAHHSMEAAYYLLPARIFELMLGAGVALFGTRGPALSRPVAELLALVGLALIVATACLLHSRHPFPGYNALYPTLGTALVIYAGIHVQTTSFRLLSLRPMVFLGGISYSLYLWHWPPMALLNYELIALTWPVRLGLVAVVVPLSWLSFRFVENRYRYRPWSLRKAFSIFVLIPLVVIWLVQATIRIADDISLRIPKERRELYQIVSQQNPADIYKECFKGKPYAFDRSDACLFGDRDAPQPNSVLIGDSHTIALLGFLEELMQGTDLSLLVITRASTPFVTAEDAREVFPDPTKVDRSRAIQEYLGDRPMTVFVSAWWDAYLNSQPEFEAYFLNALGWLLSQGHEVVILEDVPTLPSATYAYCLVKNMDSCLIDAAPVRERLAAFNQFKQAAQARFPAITWINPRQVLCDADHCLTEIEGLPLYRDESHLNYLGAQEIGRRYVERFGNPLLDR